MKMLEEKREVTTEKLLHPIIASLSSQNLSDAQKKTANNTQNLKSPPSELQQGDTKLAKFKVPKKKSPSDMKYMEAMTLEEFANSEKLDKNLLSTAGTKSYLNTPQKKETHTIKVDPDLTTDSLDPVVLLDGRPAKQGAALDRQITLFYKMECCICHENGFHFRSLMKHYKERHGVPGYVTCCDKKFHYFYPKKIIEHMAYHLQPNIFMCPSCHQNFQTSQELFEHQSNGGRSEGKIVCPRCSERYPTYHELGWHIITHRSDKLQCDYCGKQCPSCHQNFQTSQELFEHQSNGGRSEGKIVCPRCSERYPTYHELGWHIITHRSDKLQCDYCGKQLKHHHRKKTINHMEDVILCSQCIRTLRAIEKQEKEIKEKIKAKSNETVMIQKYQQKFKQAMGLSGDEDASTD
uniref:C2H2-type domain-containing protein n=1 Tax=Heliothis virescens TaxID=7102 RepID=A0A2A4J6I8_HELVI